MTRRDRVIVLSLVVLLAALAVGIVLPRPASGPASIGTPEPTAPLARAYREGVVSRPSSINPLTARTQADRDLVALVFSGLVKLGPDATIVPDLAERWTVEEKGARYTFVRSGATWQDGRRVTANDVAFTVHALQDPAYTGPAGASWREVTVTVIDPRTVRFDLRTPLGGFLQAATQPILPAHLLLDTPISQLADAPFSRDPVGSGPFRIVSRDPDVAVLEPVGAEAPTTRGRLRDDPATGPRVPQPAAPRAHRVPLLRRCRRSRRRVPVRAPRRRRRPHAGGWPRGAERPRVSPPALPVGHVHRDRLNQRPNQPLFRDEHVRRALLLAIDRDAIVDGILLGNGVRAEHRSRHHRGRTTRRPATYPPRLRPGGQGVTAAGWRKTSSGWIAPKAKKVASIEIVTLDEATSALAWRTALAVAADWKAFGLKVTVTGLGPGTYSKRLVGAEFQAAVVDVNMGLDPDVYPLLGSTQAATGGTNVGGFQSATLDAALEAARAPGSLAIRKKAYATLQKTLAASLPVLPLYFRDYLVVHSGEVEGPELRQLGAISDRYWDVLTWRLAAAAVRSPSPRVRAEVAELVDALASGASARKGVWVRLPSSVPRPRPRRTRASAQVAELVYAYV